MFELVPELAKKTHVIDLKLCSVLLEDNASYPWVILVPKIENTKNMLGLCMEDRLQLMREIDLCEEVMAENFPYDQTNVAAIGNDCSQLHVHIVCRRKTDPQWPKDVFDVSAEPYEPDKKDEITAKIKRAVMIKKTDPKYMQGMHNPDYSSYE